jgi:hydroxymethylbilane synthase
MKRIVRLATRASALAMIQARMVKKAIETCYQDKVDITILPLSTEGDRNVTQSLYEMGGKGVFIKEIERAVIQNEADIAVHSLKDVTTQLADGLMMAGFLKPESQRDVFIMKQEGQTPLFFSKNRIIGTGSLRRQALLKYLNADIRTMPIRGNIQTRLDTLASSEMDGTLLSEAGLIRLNLMDLPMEVLDPTIFIPAPGQGVIALETRKDDDFLLECCKRISCPTSSFFSKLTWDFLNQVGLDCRSPLGFYIETKDNQLYLHIFLSNQTLSHFFKKTYVSSIDTVYNDIASIVEEVLSWMKDHE